MVCVKDLVVNDDLFNERIGEDAYTVEEILELLHKHCPGFQSAASNDRVKKVSLINFGVLIFELEDNKEFRFLSRKFLTEDRLLNYSKNYFLHCVLNYKKL